MSSLVSGLRSHAPVVQLVFSYACEYRRNGPEASFFFADFWELTYPPPCHTNWIRNPEGIREFLWDASENGLLSRRGTG